MSSGSGWFLSCAQGHCLPAHDRAVAHSIAIWGPVGAGEQAIARCSPSLQARVAVTILRCRQGGSKCMPTASWSALSLTPSPR
eukprot:6762184-Pyramimonas_sp.AAC.1